MAAGPGMAGAMDEPPLDQRLSGVIGVNRPAVGVAARNLPVLRARNTASWPDCARKPTPFCGLTIGFCCKRWIGHGRGRSLPGILAFG